MASAPIVYSACILSSIYNLNIGKWSGANAGSYGRAKALHSSCMLCGAAAWRFVLDLSYGAIATEAVIFQRSRPSYRSGSIVII
jgi:hypothetical protein